MTRCLAKFAVAAAAMALIAPGSADAAWNSNGNGAGYSKARSVAAGNTPSASVSGQSVTVSWTATGGNVPVTGYIVKRYSPGGAEQTIGANCSGTVAGTSCTENGVPPGDWRYSVTPVRQTWRGNESGQSTAVTVNSPTLSLSPNNVTSLPQILTGSINNYSPGQTVTFRLDNQTTGQVLTGSITPSPVPANGTASVSVTLPNGVANGSHTIFAIGSGGDVASAAVTVAVSCTAGNQTLVATDDSWVNQAAPTSNSGGDSVLKVISKSSSQNARALVRFPTLPTIPSGCSLTTATLRLNNKSPVAGRTIQALRVTPSATPSWTEDGVTWNNQPATTGTAATATTPLTAGLMNWNVLAQMQAMYLAGASTNNGFLLRDSTESNVIGFEQQFDSAEATASVRPRLILNWGP